jgi:hypothetical protein
MEHHKCIYCGMLINSETSQININQCPHTIRTIDGENQGLPYCVGFDDRFREEGLGTTLHRVCNLEKECGEDYPCQYNWLKIQLLFWDCLCYIFEKLNKQD